MNKRHYEHTLPNIRGSLSNTYIPFTSFVICFFFFVRTSFIPESATGGSGFTLPATAGSGEQGFSGIRKHTLAPPTEKSPRIFHIEAGTQGTVHTSGTLHARLQAVRFFSTARCLHGRRQDAPWQGSPAVRKRSCHARRACGRRRPVRPSHPH